MDVAEVLPEYADAFPFEAFNEMQREALPALLERDDNVVASAPTASGKTALAELAICRTVADGGTALFLAPLRALTTEKEREWDRFVDLDHSVYVVTGERELNPRRARRADILVMTPEKLDSATRNVGSGRYDFITDVELCVIDEVHLLDSPRRGPALEVTISRLRDLCEPRIVALSATLPNVADVADWLDVPDACAFSFGDDYRPVELHTDVRTYRPADNAFANKYRRLYRALDLLEPHLREDGQGIVFVSSRRDAVTAAEKAVEELTDRSVAVGDRGDIDVHQRTDALENRTLREAILDGVAFHHAGLGRADRELVEDLFREGHVAVLFSTTTLAWGVNLPARCVVLRDTKRHDPLEGAVDVSPLDVLQMIGRAGRPGYDDVGYGWVVTAPDEADKYRELLETGTAIESRLAGSLGEHLNAEIAIGTVTRREDVETWLEGTYLAAWGGGDDLEGLGTSTVERLEREGFLALEGDGTIAPTAQGRLASRYYLRLPTAERFAAVADSGDCSRTGLIEAVAGATEFEGVAVRRAEREAIDAVLDDRRGEGLTDGQRKVLAILERTTNGTVPSDLRSDAWIIRHNATRLLSALGAFLTELGSPMAANRARRVEAAIEHGVPTAAAGVTAIDGVGSGRASKLVAEGYQTPQDVTAADVPDLVEAGFSAGIAERLLEGARSLPDLSIEWGAFPTSVAVGERDVRTVTVRNTGGAASVGIRVSVNGHPMTGTETVLRGAHEVPVGVYGADESHLEYTVEVAPTGLPVRPLRESRTVEVEFT